MFFKSTNVARILEIAQTGNLHMAAERLGVTQPALSRALKQVEEHYGEPLFERHSKGLRPTPFGAKIIGLAQNVARECDLSEQLINPRSRDFNATIRIGAGPVWAHSILPNVIGPLQTEFPDLIFEIELMTWTSGASQMAQGNLDMLAGGFKGIEDSQNALSYKNFFDVQLCIVGAKDHPIFKGGTDVFDYPWVSYQFDRSYVEKSLEAFPDITAGKPQVKLYSNSLLTTLKTLANTDYLAIVTRDIVDEFTYLDVAVIKDANPSFSIPSGIVFRSLFRGSPFFDRFCQLIQQQRK